MAHEAISHATTNLARPFELGSETGPEEFVNWTERTERRHLVIMHWLELNELWAIRQSNWTERTLLNDFELNLRNPDTTPHREQASKQANTIPPPRRQAPGRRAGISAGGNQLTKNCSSAPTKQLETRLTESSQGQNEPARSVRARAGRVRDLNWMNWTERRYFAPEPRTELNEHSRQTGD